MVAIIQFILWYIFLIAPYVFTLDVLLGLSDVVLLRCPGEDGGSTQCSGMACHIVHLVHCSGENQRGKGISREMLCYAIVYVINYYALVYAFVRHFLQKASLKCLIEDTLTIHK